MSNTNLPLSNLVVVDAGFKPAVHLPDDFTNEEQNTQLIKTYIPTSQSINFLAEVARSLNPASNERARMLHGTFGTGKSDLLLMLCNYFSRSVDDPFMQPFYTKLRRLNESQYTTIYQQRQNRLPFLVVLLQADAVKPFPGFILHGLEQALKKAGLDSLMLPTRYAAARQKIEEWQHEGHAVLQPFIAALRDNEAKELSALIKDLDSPSADLAFPAFQRSFRAATSAPFDIYSYNRPEETYKRVAQALRERGTHSGIVVVCDEFTEVLRRLARTNDQQRSEVEVEALGVQDLANISITSNQNQLHFIVSSLESFAGASAETISGTANLAIEKIGGRFKPFALDVQDSAELIRGAIRRLDERVVLPNRQHDELVEIARNLWRQPKQWVTEMVVDGCFPLHPLTTYILPTINRLVAQSNRTMFLFLKDKDGLNGFIEQNTLASPYPDWSNLLTLDVLFDYFEKSIQIRYSYIIEAYNHALQLLDRATVDTTLARRLLKVVAFCEVVAPTLSPTRQLLRYALNMPPFGEEKMQEALTLLEQVEALYPPSDAEGEAKGAYSLPMSGRVSSINLRQRVIRKARDLIKTATDLQAAYPADAIKAEEYNRRRGSYRELKAKYVGLMELNSATRLKSDLAYATDGLLWYVIASSDNERSEAQSRARELTRQYPRLVVAVPNSPLGVLDALKTYAALQEIRTDLSLDSNAKTYLQDTGLVGKGFYTTLHSALAKLREEKQWEWFREGVNQPNIVTRAQVQELASKVMQTVFPFTPEHQLSQQFKAEGITPSVSRAMTEILKREVRISKSGKKPEEVIQRIAMTGLGLLKLARTDGTFELFDLVEPTTNSNSYKVWNLYLTYLRDKKPWAKLVETLSTEPYGLYDSLLFTFTTAFFTFYADAIEITLSSGTARAPVSLDDKVLKALIESPKNYNVRFHPLTEPEKQWLRGAVTVGLKKPFDASGTQGKPLRSRVAAQIKVWLTGLHLPLFAEKLGAEKLVALIPTTTGSVIAAAVVLLQTSRTADDEVIANALLKTIPEALMASNDHNVWTNESVDTLLALWGEVCQLLTQLPSILEAYAVREVAAIFDNVEGSADEQWRTVYRWRLHRKIIENQIESLSSYERTFFRLTNQPTGTIKEALLDEFARTIIGINTSYHMWSTLDYLDRVIKEITKARDEINTRWRAVANTEEVWHDALASAASGRPMSGVQAEQVAKHLSDWVLGIPWPACATDLQADTIAKLYPALDKQQCADMSAIIKRTQYSFEDWKSDIGGALSVQFGIVGWTKAEVEQAVKRINAALKQAAKLDTILRKHTLACVSKPFLDERESPTDLTEGLRAWRKVHPIPSENDLDEAARIVLDQIDNLSDAETTLLTTLPRALPAIAQSYQQWRNYADLEQYAQIVAVAISAIHSYAPLTQLETNWLRGIVTEVLRRPLVNQPHEKHRLAQAVAVHMANWLREQRLPAFVSTLTATDLNDLFPDTPQPQLDAMLALFATDMMSSDPAHFFLVDLPHHFGIDSESACWEAPSADDLLVQLRDVCKQISKLTDATTQRLLSAIGSIFGVETNGSSPGTLVEKLRAWRQSHVLFVDEAPLSSDATLVSDLLASSVDDPISLLLITLPSKLREVRAPYGNWPSWGQREIYLQSLNAAATEITQRGHVSDATPHVEQLWEHFKSEIANLSVDEKRWLIKAFNEDFRS